MAAPKKGLSLYANLLGGDSKKQEGATISGAPVKYDTAKAENGDAEAKKKDASLQFQPIRRPQVPAKINRPAQKKSGGNHMSSSSTTTASLPQTASSPDKQPTSTVASSTPVQPGVQRTHFSDWVGDDDEDSYYADSRPRHERGGRKKHKRKKQGGAQEAARMWDWDDIYDPTLPNNYADYKGSEEQYREIRDWKARLYYHQLKEARKKSSGLAARPSDGDEERPSMNRMFAPPAVNFAPPSFDAASARPSAMDDDDYYPPSVPSRPAGTSDAYEPPMSFAPPVNVPSDTTGDNAYSRRMQRSGQASAAEAPPADPRLAGRSRPPQASAPVTQIPVQSAEEAAEIAKKKADAAVKIAAFKAKMEAHKAAKAGQNGTAAASPTPPVVAPIVQPPPAPKEPSPPSRPSEVPDSDPGTISRAPVRYNLPPPDAALPTTANEDVSMSDSEEPETRSNRPGQKGFAERLLKKYGWEKGKGLGVEGNEGITSAIVAKAEKRKKKSGAEGGGYVAPANMGKIVGGKRRKIESETEEGHGATEALPYGPLSEVIRLEGMLTGLDVDDEITNKDLYGEIGKEMEEQYGKTERVFVWRAEAGGKDEVFVKFTSQLSALRAVGACDGMEFAGNVVKARFFPTDRFEARQFD